jgi:hypothetical protein
MVVQPCFCFALPCTPACHLRHCVLEQSRQICGNFGGPDGVCIPAFQGQHCTQFCAKTTALLVTAHRAEGLAPTPENVKVHEPEKCQKN